MSKDLIRPFAVALLLLMGVAGYFCIKFASDPFASVVTGDIRIGVLFDGKGSHFGFQFVHAAEYTVDWLCGTAELLCHTAGVDGGKSAFAQHIERGVDNIIAGDFSDGRHDKPPK